MTCCYKVFLTILYKQGEKYIQDNEPTYWCPSALNQGGVQSRAVCPSKI